MIFFDLGSNTVRAISCDDDTKRKNGAFEVITRTAEKAHTTGVISDEAIARVIKAINAAQDSLNHQQAIGVATAVYRQARNGASVIAEIFEKTGLVAKIIDGETEAWLTTLAIIDKLEKNENFILVDIGGASTEVVVKSEAGMIAESFNFGIVGLAEKHRNYDAILNAVAGEMEPVKEFLRDCTYGFTKPSKFCATSGTPATIAALSLGMNNATYDAARIDGVVVSHEEMRKQMKRLLTLSSDERARLVGVGRQDLIIAGCAIFEQMYGAAGFSECFVYDDGLREGLAMAYYNKLINFGESA
ncbi:MAG: hypothetical protein RL154_1404 [Pseudomonadota bacterium]